jgi:hypothetical protein
MGAGAWLKPGYQRWKSSASWSLRTRVRTSGAGNNGPVSTATASSFLNAAGTIGRVTISGRIEAARWERRVLTRVFRAGWRLDQAEREWTWALVSARAEGISIRTLAAAIGLSPSRVHQLVAAADLDALDAAPGELRAAGWPAPEHPDSGEDTELDGRDTSADRLSDEVSWLRQCAGWLAHLDTERYPPAVNLRPAADWPDRAVVAAGLARVAAVIDRIAADVDELAPGPAGPGPGHRRGAARPAGRTPPAAGRAGPGVPGLLHPPAAARFLNPATGAGLGRLAGRAIPARRDQPAARLHRQPVPATLTTTPCHSAHQGSSGNWTL